MRHFRIALGLLLVVSLAVPPFAHADPVVAPEALRTIDFEGGNATGGMAIGPFSAESPTAWWGRITSRFHGGSYGLWVAGVQGTVPTVTPATLAYPGATSGLATVDVTQTADYYRSYLSFWYTMPSRGADDEESLNVGWDTIPSSGHSWHESSFGLTGSGAWVNVVRDFSQYPNSLNMSRQQAQVRFQFHDFITDAAQGEGATIDDIEITGVKYGPPRALVATQSGGSVLVSWDTPSYRIASSADDTRSMTYRVWRSPGTGPSYTWTELTAVRQAARSFVDTGVPLGGPYTYTVQAWDPGSGPGNGEIATATVTTVGTLGPAVAIDKTVNKSVVLAGTSVTYTYQVANTGDSDLTGVNIEDARLGHIAGPFGLTVGQAATYTTQTVITTDASDVATVTGSALATTVSDSDTADVDVINPAISVSKSVAPPSITLGASVTYTFTIANGGDTPLEAVSLTDDVIGPVVSGISLASGESTQITRVRTPSASESGAAHATGHPSLLPAEVVSASSAGVGVIVNSPPPPPPPPAPDPVPAPAPAPVTPSITGHTLYTPVTPSTVYYGRSFTIYSFLKPRHKAGLYSLKYEGYRYERQSNGTYKWVRRATWYGKNYNYSTYTKCIKTGAVLKLRGKWRVRAVHTHTGYLPKYSGYRYFAVK